MIPTKPKQTREKREKNRGKKSSNEIGIIKHKKEWEPIIRKRKKKKRVIKYELPRYIIWRKETTPFIISANNAPLVEINK